MGANIQLGNEIHNQTLNHGSFRKNIHLQNSLISFFGKTDNLEKSISVFKKIKKPDLIGYNALISAFIQNEKFGDALFYFKQMKRKKISPDDITFSLILKVYAELKELDVGLEMYENIPSQFKNEISTQASLINLYGKCARKMCKSSRCKKHI